MKGIEFYTKEVCFSGKDTKDIMNKAVPEEKDWNL